MNDINKKRVAYAILILAIVLAGVLGVQYPIPAPPDSVFAGIMEVPVVRGPANYARFLGPVLFKNTVQMDQAVTMAGAQTNSGALTVAGATALNGGLTMDTNKFTVADTSGNTLIAGSLTANGGLTMDGGIVTIADATGNTIIGGSLLANSATITGATALNGGLTMDTTAFTVADTTGNTVIAGSATVASLVITGSSALNGGLTMDTSAFTVADTSGNVSTAGTLAVAGTSTLSGKVVGAPSGVIVLADDFTLVPTRTVQLVSADGAIGGVIGTDGAVAGQFLYLVNVGAQNIVLTDTGTLKLAGNATLTGDDAVTLIFDGTNWVQVSAVSAN